MSISERVSEFLAVAGIFTCRMWLQQGFNWPATKLKPAKACQGLSGHVRVRHSEPRPPRPTKRLRLAFELFRCLFTLSVCRHPKKSFSSRLFIGDSSRIRLPYRPLPACIFTCSPPKCHRRSHCRYFRFVTIFVTIGNRNSVVQLQHPIHFPASAALEPPHSSREQEITGRPA